MTRASGQSRSSAAQASNPLIWIAVDGYAPQRSKASAAPRVVHQPVSGGNGLDADGLIALWSRLSRRKAMPGRSDLASREIEAMAECTIVFDIFEKAQFLDGKLKVRHVGQAAARAIGIDDDTSALGLLEGTPLLPGWLRQFSDVFDLRRPVAFVNDSADGGEPGQRYECVLLPFGDEEIESVVAVVMEAGRSPQICGETVLDLEVSSIVGTTVSADALGHGEDYETLVSTSATKRRGKAADNLPGLPISSLISEAREAAEAAREAAEVARMAERKSRNAANEALGRSFALAMALVKSPEEIAVQLIFGDDLSADELARYVGLLRAAREEEVAETAIFDFLEGRA